jgi:phosphate starvation-inducible protein PhoH and related proteins
MGRVVPIVRWAIFTFYATGVIPMGKSSSVRKEKKSRNGRNTQFQTVTDISEAREARNTPKHLKHHGRDAERFAERRKLVARNPQQAALIAALDGNRITVATGPAGTGKTFVGMMKMCQLLESKAIQRIIITRPIVEACGEKLGFLPGDVLEKVMPYLKPYFKALIQFYGDRNQVERLIKEEKIEVSPLAYMRGETFDDAGIVLDEAQNTNPEQMKMFLTRMGRNSRVLVDGDVRQSDMKGKDGLSDLMARAHLIPSLGHIELTKIERDPIVEEILVAYATELAPVA